ncbi:MAG TPA: hypothetical protein H9684_10250 [Firmicutes bacterium]|nr:hypothetical protein [Bacillota bacterium]
MRKNRIRSIVIHEPDSGDIHALADKISEFHADVIERKLHQSGLTMEQKIAVIDKILEDLKSREIDGLIK